MSKSQFKWVKLKDIATSEKNSIVDGPFGSNLKINDYVAEGIPVLQGQNITYNKFNFKGVRFITEEKAYELRRSKVFVGDVLIVKIGSIGYSALINHLNDFPYGIIPANLAKVTPDKKIIDVNYLCYWLNSSQTVLYLKSISSKTAQPALSLEKIKEIPIPLPPLDVQKKIAAVLDKADRLRQLRKAAIEKLDQLTQSVFLEMFGDPVTNPKGFLKVKIADIITTIKDGPHVSPKYCDSGIPILSTRNIRPSALVLNDVKYVSVEEYKKITKQFKPKKGDVLLTKGGTTGYSKAVDFDWPFCIWVHIAALRPNEKVVPQYLESALNSRYCYLQSQKFTHGIANRDLGLTRIVNIEMLLPPKTEQNKFAAIINKVDQQKKEMQRSLDKMDDTFNSLLQRAFKGELDFNDDFFKNQEKEGSD